MTRNSPLRTNATWPESPYPLFITSLWGLPRRKFFSATGSMRSIPDGPSTGAGKSLPPFGRRGSLWAGIVSGRRCARWGSRGSTLAPTLVKGLWNTRSIPIFFAMSRHQYPHHIWGIPASVGFIALFGVAIQNGVLLLSFAKEEEAKGRLPREAIRSAAPRRIRPVLMTALVGATGILLLFLSTGTGANIQRPLTVGGLISSTAMTLLVLPAFYLMVFRERTSNVSRSSRGGYYGE